MKILYLDPCSFESYGIFPSVYGGGGQLARWAKEYLNDDENEFWIAARAECFKDLKKDERGDRCITLTQEQADKIIAGDYIDNSVNLAIDVDLIVHHFTEHHFNTSRCRNDKQLVWNPGQYEKNHEKNDYLLFHNFKLQLPQLNNPKAKLYSFVLGVPLPEFELREKSNYLFQCSNHYPEIDTKNVCKLAQKYGIKTIIAGPIAENYKELLNYVDGKTVQYLGEISEENKIEFLKKAAGFTCFHQHKINFSTLASRQALSYGVPIFTTGAGHFGELIKNGINGFIIKSESDFINAWKKRNTISQWECYKSVQNQSISHMVESFKEVCHEVISDA